jgi:hypothetical protein
MNLWTLSEEIATQALDLARSTGAQNIGAQTHASFGNSEKPSSSANSL